MRLVPPIAVPVGLADIAASIVPREPGIAAFRDALSSSAGFPTAELFPSGRAALAAWLATRKSTDGAAVAIPAYTCWSVPASAVRAGLRVRLVDIDPLTLDFDHDALFAAVSEPLAAVVAAHLFARSSDIEGVCALVSARAPGTIVVEDCAQAWPGASPSPADAVLLSFGRGKPLPLGGGGAVLHRGRPLDPGREKSSTGLAGAVVFASTRFLAHPVSYRALEALPFLGVGTTVYDPGFPMRGSLHGWQARLGCRTLSELPLWAERRTAHARRLADRIGAIPGWTITKPAGAEGPLRLPVLAPSRGARDAVSKALRRRGVASSAMYPGTLADIPSLRPHVINPDARLSGATEVAARILTLPVFPTLTQDGVDGIAAAFEHAVVEAGR